MARWFAALDESTGTVCHVWRGSPDEPRAWERILDRPEFESGRMTCIVHRGNGRLAHFVEGVSVHKGRTREDAKRAALAHLATHPYKGRAAAVAELSTRALAIAKPVPVEATPDPWRDSVSDPAIDPERRAQVEEAYRRCVNPEPPEEKA